MKFETEVAKPVFSGFTFALLIGFVIGCSGCDSGSQPLYSADDPRAQTEGASSIETEAMASTDSTRSKNSADHESESRTEPMTKEETGEVFKKFGEHFGKGEFEQANVYGKQLSEFGKGVRDFQDAFAEAAFASSDAASAVEAYDRIVSTSPHRKPQLWQRGIALYYNNQFAEGAEQFNTHQNFNSQDVENSVWQLMCNAKVTSVEEARKQMIPIELDRRQGMKEIFDMFAGGKTPADVLEACDFQPGDKIEKDSTLYHAFLYIGLYQDMVGEYEKSREAMKQALQAQPNNRQFMYWIARVHLATREKKP